MVGIESYFLGSCIVRNFKRKHEVNQSYFCSVNILFISFVVLFAFFIISGGLQYFYAMYHNLTYSDKGIYGYRIVIHAICYAYNVIIY